MKQFSIIMLVLFFGYAYSQECSHENLSVKYNFKTSIKRFNISGQLDSCVIVVDVFLKNTVKPLQKIKYDSAYMFEDVFSDCNNYRSYSTGFNKDSESPDNDFGDLIVCDFNFDGREDFALKASSGGNGGPVYYYHIQNSRGLFAMDNFLTETMEFFPIEVNPKKKTLMTSVHANAYQNCETTYKYNGKSGMWKKAHRRFVGMEPPR
ncbi:MAG: XAC2610-related protein [Flavobacterium sp.]